MCEYNHVCAVAMVLKKSKHGLNTGNTLRRCDKSLINKCQRGTVQFRFDADTINNMIDQLHHCLFDGDSTWISFNSEKAQLLLTLTRFVECQSMFEMANYSVEYSLSKLHRWNIHEYLLPYLNEIYMVSSNVLEFDVHLKIKVKEDFGFWYSHEFVSCPQSESLIVQQQSGAQRKNLTKTHVRGIQRKWKDATAMQRNCSVVTETATEINQNSIDSDDDNDESDNRSYCHCKPTR